MLHHHCTHWTDHWSLVLIQWNFDLRHPICRSHAAATSAGTIMCRRPGTFPLGPAVPPCNVPDTYRQWLLVCCTLRTLLACSFPSCAAVTWCCCPCSGPSQHACRSTDVKGCRGCPSRDCTCAYSEFSTTNCVVLRSVRVQFWAQMPSTTHHAQGVVCVLRPHAVTNVFYCVWLFTASALRALAPCRASPPPAARSADRTTW